MHPIVADGAAARALHHGQSDYHSETAVCSKSLTLRLHRPGRTPIARAGPKIGAMESAVRWTLDRQLRRRRLVRSE